jgi:hypothetical protein
MCVCDGWGGGGGCCGMMGGFASGGFFGRVGREFTKGRYVYVFVCGNERC